MDGLWISGLMVWMYFMGSFVTWYIIKGIDDNDVEYWKGYNAGIKDGADDNDNY